LPAIENLSKFCHGGREMARIDLARKLVETLPGGMPGLFNPWTDRCSEDEPCNGPESKFLRLAAHLDCEPEFILCGEAPGYQGCRHSGIAFTSERLLLLGKIPRIPVLNQRLTNRKNPYSEPSATIVWNSLYALGIESRTILWNALQLHPHRPGEDQTNRTPTNAEIELGRPALRILVAAFSSAKIVAVGKKAEMLLRSMDLIPAATVRHPANGGASAFAEGMRLVSGQVPKKAATERSLFDDRDPVEG
jgi:uracil-DNA glycosylase